MKTPNLIPLSLCCLAVSQFAVAQTDEQRADQRPVIPPGTFDRELRKAEFDKSIATLGAHL